MLDFAIFAVTLLVAILCAVFYLYPASRKSSGFPGLSPTDEKDGNLADIVAAGSLHAFLERLHRTHGPASSFWFGRRLVVSLASLPLLREHINPNCTCDPFEAMLKSLLGFEAKGTHVGDHFRRKLYEKAVNKALHASMEMLIELSHELQKQWQSLPIDEHIPLHQHMMGFALRAITCATLGQSFAGGSQLLALRRNHDALWSEIGKGFLDGSLERDLNRRKHFDNALQEMRVRVERAVVGTKCGVSEVSSPTAFLDILLQGSDSSEQVVEDAMTFCLAGCNMAANCKNLFHFFFLEIILQSG
uniref:Cytochrome P450, family 20, subfamily A, polypeptide 1 n=1 Tax=Eptatretus burgeri TaxID=7764 RepID=A0A8C4QUL2_EPTBU